MDNISRNNYRLFKILTEMFNFKIFLRRGRLWGGRTENGSWTGVVGLLNRSEIDFSVTGVRWDDDRYGVFESTTDSFYVE